MTKELKNKVADIIIEMNEVCSGNAERKEIDSEAGKIKDAHAFIIGNQTGDNPTEFMDVILKQMKTEYKKVTLGRNTLPNDDQVYIVAKKNTADYLENVKEENKTTPFYDILTEFYSTHTQGTKTLKDIISELNKNGANIEIAYEELGQNKKKFTGFNQKFVLVMPSSSFVEFNKSIIKDYEKSSEDVILTDKKDYFFMNHFDKELTIDTIKEKISHMRDNEEISPVDETYGVRSLFRDDMGMGLVEIPQSNFNIESKVGNAIREYLSSTYNLKMNNPVNKAILVPIESHKLEDTYIFRKVNPYDESIKFKESLEQKVSNTKIKKPKNH